MPLVPPARSPRRGAGNGASDGAAAHAAARSRTPRHPLRTAFRSPQRGSAALFTILIAVVTMGLAGMVVDGGLAISQRERAMDIAEQAARRVSDHIDTDELRASNTLVIKGGGCYDYANQVVASFGKGTITGCTVAGGTVNVHVDVSYTPLFLGFFADRPFTASGTATAHPVAGINSGGN